MKTKLSWSLGRAILILYLKTPRWHSGFWEKYLGSINDFFGITLCKSETIKVIKEHILPMYLEYLEPDTPNSPLYFTFSHGYLQGPIKEEAILEVSTIEIQTISPIKDPNMSDVRVDVRLSENFMTDLGDYIIYCLEMQSDWMHRYNTLLLYTAYLYETGRISS